MWEADFSSGLMVLYLFWNSFLRASLTSVLALFLILSSLTSSLKSHNSFTEYLSFKQNKLNSTHFARILFKVMSKKEESSKASKGCVNYQFLGFWKLWNYLNYLVGMMWLRLMYLTKGLMEVLFSIFLEPILLVTFLGDLSTPATRAWPNFLS